ncbi:MAG: heavy metal-binding domain-containing protein [Paludibacteraceae bacterium]|nr:heavy metal-binding domain-containing protein [Paludibacteraceae bacterium]
MIITTTNSIENAKIEKYLGVVTTNLVIGTNFFSDFKASFTDFFGGMSGTYRKQMDTLYQRAYNALSIKASSLGANCVLGFKIDFDELSGKGTQMFMISVSGTAVKICFEASTNTNITNSNIISSDRLNIELFKEKWAKRDQNTLPKAQELNFIIENNLWELASSLYDCYVMTQNTYEDNPLREKFPYIISAMNYNDIIKFIYKDYPQRKNYAYVLIKNNNLFNAEKVLQILKENHISLAIELLKTEKSEYNKDDIKVMEEIISHIDNLPNKGKIEEVKSGLLSSKIVEMYICPNGHKNNKEVEFCEDTYCGLNIKGLNQEQVNTINLFKNKLRIIKTLLQ